jgi:hypothetical protein
MYGYETCKMPRRNLRPKFHSIVPLAITSNMLVFAYPLIRFLEHQTPVLQYSVATDHDTQANPNFLTKRRSVILAGHGEYWTYRTRANLDGRCDMRTGSRVASQQ